MPAIYRLLCHASTQRFRHRCVSNIPVRLPAAPVTALLLSLWAGLPSAALSQKGTAQITGTVTDLTTHAVIVNADVIHLGLGRVTVTDSSGKFLLTDLQPGIVRILVRAKGYPSSVNTIALARGEFMTRDFELDSSATGRANAQKLPSVAVSAPKPAEPRYADFERRRATGRGHYITRDDIEKGGFANLQDAMKGIRGVALDCGGATAGAASGTSLGCNIRMARAPMRCNPEYIVDERVDNDFGPNIAIRDIEALEVYTGPSDVPGEFAGRYAGCGVIVIWTKNGPPRKKP